MIKAVVEYNHLKSKASGLDQAISIGVRKIGFDIQARSTANAPVDTGKLRASHYLEVISLTEVEVGNSAEYAEWVDQGTRKMAARPYFTGAVEAIRPTAPGIIGAIVRAHMES